ncbi:hypothetical protein AMAG_07682 [Allomyces macrogynus ATCC 38327]|uniref:Uncharacterized protein n=1 Tax=Allomyces macrogynus (strain ATCC 38327) TaxID=578462 RepID=A0A0L0SJD9_ALLM3|nr:hypothetical protein AMAG_07682 [Allomyces macrogynus ATCC 38327]|eukprot:KNE62465.1 hypothetical protein AMAG_07682 [Allomyces macrogynus ATCC 38327]
MRFSDMGAELAAFIPGTVITVAALARSLYVAHERRSLINLLVIGQWLAFLFGDVAVWIGDATVTVPGGEPIPRRIMFLSSDAGTALFTVSNLLKIRIFRVIYPRVPARLAPCLAALTCVVFVVSLIDYVVALATTGRTTWSLLLKIMPFAWGILLDVIISTCLVYMVLRIDWELAAVGGRPVSTEFNADTIHITLPTFSPPRVDVPFDPGLLAPSSTVSRGSTLSRPTTTISPPITLLPPATLSPLALRNDPSPLPGASPPAKYTPDDPPPSRTSRAAAIWRSLHPWSRRILATQLTAATMAVTMLAVFIATGGATPASNAAATVTRAYAALGMVFLHSTIAIARNSSMRRSGTVSPGRCLSAVPSVGSGGLMTIGSRKGSRVGLGALKAEPVCGAGVEVGRRGSLAVTGYVDGRRGSGRSP